jgi:hypothetical protein
MVPLSDDAATIIERSLIGQPIGNTISALLKNAENNRYLDDGDDFVLISMTPMIDGLNVELDDIKSDIATGSSKNEIINIMYISGDMLSLKEARRNNISAGRYYLYEELKSTKSSITVESARTMELKDLINRKIRANNYEDHMNDYNKSTIRMIITEEAPEQAPIRKRKYNEEHTESESPDEGEGSNNRKAKEYGQQPRKQNHRVREDQSETDSNEDKRIRTEENRDSSQQTVVPTEEVQNKFQNNNGPSEDNGKPGSDGDGNAEPWDSDKEKDNRGGAELDNGDHGNKPNNSGRTNQTLQ